MDTRNQQSATKVLRFVRKEKRARPLGAGQGDYGGGGSPSPAEARGSPDNEGLDKKMKRLNVE